MSTALEGEPTVFENIQQFLQSKQNKVIRYCIYRRMFTPYEEQHGFMDQSFYEDGSHLSLGVIQEAVILPDNDVLLGIARIYESLSDLQDDSRCLEYCKLSEIRLIYYPEDTQMLAEEDIYGD